MSVVKLPSHSVISYMPIYVRLFSPAEWELLPRLNASQRGMSVKFLIDEFVAAQVMFGAVTDEGYELKVENKVEM